MLALTLPWFVAIMIRTEGAFLTASLGGDLAEKIAATGEHSGIPPGFYLLAVWATLWPWTLLLPLAVVTGWAMRKAPEGAFLLGWIVPTWLVFEAVSTKLIHYTLPTYPALLLLAAVPLVRLIDGEARFRGWAAHIGAAGFAIGTLAFAALAIGMPMAFGAGIDLWAMAGGLALTALAAFGAVAFYRGRALLGTAALAGAGIVMAWTLTAASLPGAREFWVTPRLAEAMAGQSCLAMPPAVVGHAPAERRVPVRHRHGVPRLGGRDGLAGRSTGPRRVDRPGGHPGGYVGAARATRRHRSGRNRLHQRTPRASAALRVAGCPPRRTRPAADRPKAAPPKPIAKKARRPEVFPTGRRSRFPRPGPGARGACSETRIRNRSFSITLVQAATRDHARTFSLRVVLGVKPRR